MFRSFLRSLSDPIREHVRLFSLPRRIQNPTRSRHRRFYSSDIPNSPYQLAPADLSTQISSTPSETSSGTEVKVPPELSPQHLASESQNHRPGQSQDERPADLPTANSTEGNAPSQNKDDQGTDSLIAGQESGKEASKEPGGQVKKATNEGKRPDKKKRVRKKPAAAKRTAPTKSRRKTDIVRRSKPKRRKKGNRSASKTEDRKLPFLSLATEHQTGSLSSTEIAFTPLNIERAPVPTLSFGLERVLFNPGVYHLQDPRSRVFNFDPYLGSIMPVTEFDFDALKQYITSSKDDTLLKLATKEDKKYVGSSSSMTSVLSHFHYLLSAWRGINVDTISIGFPDKLRTFTRLLRAPAAMFLHYKDGVHAIDADKEFDNANILMNLGKSMEKLLTLPKEEFERYRRSSANKITAEEERSVPESYHYSTLGDFVMRSQLDAHDSRLPGTGMFDLKTRAVVSIRMDAKNFEHGLGYEIKRRFGGYESYEREFFDMIRAAFLKYSLQVRVGRMDGIFVAFHNIERIFGFQYISLPEMDLALHGQTNTSLGDKEFQLSLALWNQILNRVTTRFPKKSLRFHFETRDARIPYMLIFAEPVTSEEIEAIQSKNKAEIEAFQQRVLNLERKTEGEALTSEGTETEHQAADEAERQEPSEEITQSSDSSEAKLDGEEEAPRDLFALMLTVNNKVNGRPVVRPKTVKAEDDWSVEYQVSQMDPGPKVRDLYKACQRRRQKALASRGEDEAEVASNVYIRRLREISKEGREWRVEQDRLDQGRGTVILES